MQSLGSSRVTNIIRPPAANYNYNYNYNYGGTPQNSCHPAGAERLHKNPRASFEMICCIQGAEQLFYIINNNKVIAFTDLLKPQKQHY